MTLVVTIVMEVVMANINGPKFKENTRKCCLMSEILVEVGPGNRTCTNVNKIGLGVDLKPMMWRGLSLANFAIFHGEPVCGEGETLFPAYHHAEYQGRTENLELANNGSLSVSWGDQGHMARSLTNDKYCVDKLLMSHNYSHIYEGDVTHFAYVCLNMDKSVSEIVETVVYPIGVSVSMSCLTLTFLLYSFLPQLRDLTGKFILGICSFLTTNYALKLVDVKMFVGFKVKPRHYIK